MNIFIALSVAFTGSWPGLPAKFIILYLRFVINISTHRKEETIWILERVYRLIEIHREDCPLFILLFHSLILKMTGKDDIGTFDFPTISSEIKL